MKFIRMIVRVSGSALKEQRLLLRAQARSKLKCYGVFVLALAVMKTVVISSLKMVLLRLKECGIMMRREITMVVQELALHLIFHVVILPLKAAKLQLTAVDMELVLVKEVKYFVKPNAAQLKF